MVYLDNQIHYAGDEFSNVFNLIEHFEFRGLTQVKSCHIAEALNIQCAFVDPDLIDYVNSELRISKLARWFRR